jgi:phosphohistidine swiveling domain-containing protein
MNVLVTFESLADADRPRVGGKAWSLSRLAREGFSVPLGAVVPVEVYEAYVGPTGLRERILLELNRKPFESMRWEEMWDAALRIRNLFLKTPMPGSLYGELYEAVRRTFGDHPVAVRSSAPGEDSAGASFAGLHESYLNVRGADSVAEHVRLVWASLWSDGALLYRQELKLDVGKSAMAVVIQELTEGERSGVAFSKSPADSGVSLVEAVWGLNQGLVDGTVQPDRWVLERSTGRLREHLPVERLYEVRTAPEGTRRVDLGMEKRELPPLADGEVGPVWEMSMEAERCFGCPQDVEWTFSKGRLFTLQSRPVTAGAEGEAGSRAWNLSLRRSFENLKALGERIRETLVPALVEEAGDLSRTSVGELGDGLLAEVLKDREEAFLRWSRVYWDEFIPFAHGARLFGQVYNDRVKPEDPFRFIDLLRPRRMVGTDRNARLEEASDSLRRNPALKSETKAFLEGNGETPGVEAFLEGVSADLGADTDLVLSGTGSRRALAGFLLEMASRPKAARSVEEGREALERAFLDCFEGEERAFAGELLELARASYRLRDEDNIYLGRVERLRTEALDEAGRRLGKRLGVNLEGLETEDACRALEDPSYRPVPAALEKKEGTLPAGPAVSVRARQLVGQPAGPGLARGVARVVRSREDLLGFKSGEILVCDAIDPNMTFVVPLCSGIVERRGGMLIHGAIIAREYGLPCVTGVPGATGLIRSGDNLTVDGYLGIVVIHGQG